MSLTAKHMPGDIEPGLNGVTVTLLGARDRALTSGDTAWPHCPAHPAAAPRHTATDKPPFWLLHCRKPENSFKGDIPELHFCAV